MFYAKYANTFVCTNPPQYPTLHPGPSNARKFGGHTAPIGKDGKNHWNGKNYVKHRERLTPPIGRFGIALISLGNFCQKFIRFYGQTHPIVVANWKVQTNALGKTFSPMAGSIKRKILAPNNK
jgi:hypothetical protein